MDELTDAEKKRIVSVLAKDSAEIQLLALTHKEGSVTRDAMLRYVIDNTAIVRKFGLEDDYIHLFQWFMQLPREHDEGLV